MRVFEIIDRALSDFAFISEGKRAILGKLDRPGTRIFVVGRNNESSSVIAALPVSGLVDDYCLLPAAWNGVEVVRSEQLPIGAVVINCSTSISPLSVIKRFEMLQGVEVINYCDLCRGVVAEVPLPDFVSQSRKLFVSEQARCSEVMERLSDRESKLTFQKLISFRLTAMPAFMEGFQNRPQQQYFEKFAAPKDGAVFADCGGFDGDTSSEIIRRYPNYGGIYFFEPDIANLTRAKENLQGARDIKFVPKGVSDVPGRLNFHSGKGSASAISDGSGPSIEVTTLDAAISEPVSFVKMDLEGWEIPALKGGRDHIAKDRPILAVAAYHKASDFWTIPELVFSMNSEYQLYLRHYTEGWSESVFYFVPKSKRSSEPDDWFS